jgi:tRNA dimethylallyltransferase
MTHPLLVVLLGPTASGKTALSLHLAERFDGEIISCDSVAVYRGMDLGSAKPSARERARIPHHLLDLTSPDRTYTAGDYSRDARVALAQITGRNHLPIVTGGSGLYLRALLDGLFAGPQRSEPLRARLRASGRRHGAGWLHRLLLRLDPASAARIHAHDEPKLIRAIEVAITTRQPLSAALAAPEGRNPLTGYRILRLGLQPDRAELYARINQRAAAMFADGLVEETRALLSAYQPPPPALGALGYRQAALVLAGEILLADAVADARQGHRNYAKRQLTWFRREPEVTWLSGFGSDPAVQLAASHAVSSAMQGG